MLYTESGTAMVRVTDKETSQRTLIREPQKEVKDLAFAYVRTEVVLGVVDAYGTVFVYNIERTQSDLSYPFCRQKNWLWL